MTSLSLVQVAARATVAVRPRRLRPAQQSEIIGGKRGVLVPAVSHERLLLDNLTLINTLAGRIGWRGGLAPHETDDFRSLVVEKLVDRDYEILRRFEHRSSLRTYLATVITRLFQDYRNHVWGKWRPSAEARGQGDVALHLERMLTRDGLTLDEAGTLLRTVHRVELSDEALLAMAQSFPVRARRRHDGEEALAQVPDPSAGAEAQLEEGRLRDGAARTREALERALTTLSDDDQVLIRLCFWERMSVADVARSFGVPQKPLYRRIEKILKRLRAALGDAGVDEQARTLLEHRWSDFLETPFAASAVNGSAVGIGRGRPSTRAEVTGARD